MAPENEKTNSRSTSRLAGLINSPLERALVGGFVVIAIIQSAFLAILCLDVLRTDKSATREYELLRGSQGISSMILVAQKVFDAAELARKNPEKSKVDIFESRYKEATSTVDTMISEFVDMKLDPAPVKRVQAEFVSLHDTIVGLMPELEDLRTASKSKWRTLIYKTEGLYKAFMKEMKAIHGSLRQQHEGPLFGVQPQILLYVAGAADLLLAVALLLLIDRGITAPIRKLAGNCEMIATGEPLSAPTPARNEIGSLEQSFYEMSLVISDSEKRRRNFLEFFQSVQTASLEHVHNLFNDLSGAPTLSDKAKRSIQKAQTNLNSLLQLLQSMTEALTHNTSTRVEPHFATSSTTTLVQNAAASVEALLQKRQITLNITCPEHAFMVDQQLIGRVLTNFLSNAIKYSPDGGDVSLTVTQTDSILHFAVQDKGPGISVEDQQKLFQEFRQVKAEDGIKRSGTGLGLMICKQIVEASGGKVGIDSAPGKGSTFWFDLPFWFELDAQPALLDTASASEKAHSVSAHKAKGTIKTAFVLMMLCFIIPQTATVFKLHAMFDDASKRLQNFRQHKELLMTVEEMLAIYLTFKIRIAKAADTQDLDSMATAAPFLDLPQAKISQMLAQVPPNSEEASKLKKMRSGFKALQKISNYLASNKETSIAIIPKMIKKAKAIVRNTERSLFDLLELQHSGVQSSWDFSVKLRTELLWALLAAGLVNIVLLIAVTALGLRITERISELKHKAEDFAGGKRLEVSLSGNDELTFLDESLCQVSQAIKDADAQRQKIIAVINHDLRTPLTSIINALQMILASGYGDIGEKEKALTSAAEEELSRLLQQINDLLLIEKIDAGLYELSSEKFDLVPVLETAAESFQTEAAAKGVTVLPQLNSSNATINGDKSLVEREIVILLSNAVKAAPQGSTVELAVSCDGAQCLVSVKDHGAGIKEELLPQIFQRFRFVGGRPITGLGLPLAERLSKIHGGSLILNSTAAGTEARVTLPVAA